MADQLFIGIDNGTQGTKCVVFSRGQGRILAADYAPHGMIENADGRREQEAAWWIAAAEKTLAAVLAAPGVDPRDVVAIGVSGQQHGFVALDAAGEVLRPVKLWCDTETVAQCGRITEAAGGPAAVVAATGNAVAAGFTASKVLWLKENEPALFDRLATVLLPHDYLNFWLTGARRMECGDASGTAFFDVRRRTWSEAMVRAIDPSGKLAAALPELIASDEPVGLLRPELAARFGLSTQVIVSSGGGDNMMAAIGTGNVSSGMVTASLGTSGTIYACSDKPVIDPAGELAAFCSSSGSWLPLVCTMNVTVATEQARALLGLDVKAFDAEVAKAPAGAEGIRLLPYFNGERTPPLPKAKATFTGISTANFSRANFCRAAMEGATLGLRYGLDLMKKQGLSPSEIRLVGGGAKSRVWRQIVADVFATPVVCPESAEAGAMGCVLQAMWCHDRQRGEVSKLADLCAQYLRLDETTRALPSADAAAYDAVYAEYRAFDAALAPLSR